MYRNGLHGKCLYRIEVLIKLMMADFEAYEPIRRISPSWAFVFIAFYVLFVSIVSVNVIIAVLTDTWDDDRP